LQAGPRTNTDDVFNLQRRKLCTILFSGVVKTFQPSLHDENFIPVWSHVECQLPHFSQATGPTSSQVRPLHT
jgi:hypothetical protein